MARFEPNHSSLDYNTLKDAVVVLSGGASGIGAAIVRLLHGHGAKIVFGDLDTAKAEAVVASTSPSSVHFVMTDVTSYTDIVDLFRFALSKYGRVDHAIANAGLIEQPGWFDPRLGIEGVAHKPTTKTSEVNFNGVLYFANIACTYLAHKNQAAEKNSKSLTLLSSVAGFKETPGLFVYQGSKHAVMGLLRALRLYVPEAYPGIRINAVLPSMTLTGMVEGIKDGWMSADLPVNKPEDVATALVGLCVAGPGTDPIWYDEEEAEGVKKMSSAGGMDWDHPLETGVNGRGIFIMGGNCYDIEEGLDRTEELWLGKKVSGWLQKGQQNLGNGTHWLKEK
ncbi:hypothetical protein HRR83_000990 [Exophiala dermatitidis]|uniref:3-oxoacyl-[acyl-carrier protein] reductase n=1 Tax=Exophiala dermatitidis TaxID=5970 RepID=A0AAN6IYM8_EXODE|nr:hypothetical protein HRR75_000902 [Exophiala dermatitidis]KAJ4528239.1 hypothetical protein HRR74_000994 [Exophiala dermatitidis]KAJ4528872.1 hypothetical protein HRR73_001495 [Exophiala dermatitidis]KAJ4530263.1 hypothetical protein HRR76_009491 [Exophiala dermatitidis]KAJ4553198.1 hypothetical protein HRR78_003457 [Exophiala dermatitidis]